MKQKVIQFLLILGIVSIPIIYIIRENTDFSVRYIAIVFSVLSILFSLFISSVMLKFIYKIFVQFSKETSEEIQSLFFGYIFLNSLISFSLKDTTFLSIYNLVNPILLIFVSLITIIYHGMYSKDKLFYAAIVFYTTNVIFALIGVMMNNV